jgi:hypothetical protein
MGTSARLEYNTVVLIRFRNVSFRFYIMLDT